jgi:hypothetical protein
MIDPKNRQWMALSSVAIKLSHIDGDNSCTIIYNQTNQKSVT